jgi:hypothetical protein
MSVIPVQFGLINRSPESYAEAASTFMKSMSESPEAMLLIALMPKGTVRLRVESSSHLNNLELLGLLDRARHMVLCHMSGEITETCDVPGDEA